MNKLYDPTPIEKVRVYIFGDNEEVIVEPEEIGEKAVQLFALGAPKVKIPNRQSAHDSFVYLLNDDIAYFHASGGCWTTPIDLTTNEPIGRPARMLEYILQTE